MSTSIAPTPEEVALLVLARTRAGSGKIIGQFTDQTTPSLQQVEGIISSVRTRVIANAGPFDATKVIRDDDDGVVTLGDIARETIANGAAARIERAMEPEAASAADSAYAQLHQDYLDGLQVLKESTTTDPEDVQGFASVGITSPTLAAAWRFPPTIGGPEIPGEES
jgi:hypothetical protein